MLKKTVVIALSLCTICALTVSAADSTESRSDENSMSIERIIENDIKVGLESIDKGPYSSFGINKQSDIMKSNIKQIEEDFVGSFGEEENAKSDYQGLTFLTDMAYKIYTLNNEDIIATYEATQNIGDIISDNYLIKVPINNLKGHMIGLATFYLVDGKWQLGSYGKMEEKQTMFTDTKEIIKQLEKSSTKLESFTDGKVVQQLRVIVLNKYDTYAIFIKTTMGECILPISTNNQYTKLKVNKVYSASDFIKTLSLNSQENEGIQKNSEAMYGGGAVVDTNNISANVVNIVLCVFGIVALSIFIKKQKLFSSR